MTHPYLITFIKTVFSSSELQNLKKKTNGKLLHIVNIPIQDYLSTLALAFAVGFLRGREREWEFCARETRGAREAGARETPAKRPLFFTL